MYICLGFPLFWSIFLSLSFAWTRSLAKAERGRCLVYLKQMLQIHVLLLEPPLFLVHLFVSLILLGPLLWLKRSEAVVLLVLMVWCRTK
ncbi:hypothetical protein CPB84DRAFT_863134 [Gymnopilus junonius]|uniref:Uncharacterized protein n=1 Tax=Gymnopilus junonius TaxID=109634 RepID=A0A9P5TPV1_GYMJU|nr:hypothetical protein CPB84DRAFT_863134 [Gymnopilus junonius]